MSRIYKEERVGLAEFAVLVQYKDVKNLALRLKPDGSICLSAPAAIDKRSVKRFLEEHLPWLREKTKAMEGTPRRPLRYDMSLPFDGASLYLWGRRLPVRFIERAGARRMQVLPNRVNLYVRRSLDGGQQAATVKDLYKKLTEQAALPLLHQWQQRMGVRYTELRLRQMKSLWGSCNVRTGAVTLNILLACWPQPCLELIVVHELAHLLVPNHSPAFKRTLDTYLPDWKRREQVLKSFRPVF